MAFYKQEEQGIELKIVHLTYFLNQIPINLFEVGDVVLKDDTRETNTRNERRLCALYTSHNSELEVIHGLLDYLMKKLKVPKETKENVT